MMEPYYRDQHRKGSAICKVPLKSIYNQNNGFDEQKMYFWTLQEVQTIKNLLIDIIFVTKIFFWQHFQSCPL
jgi:hypothetical protein